MAISTITDRLKVHIRCKRELRLFSFLRAKGPISWDYPLQTNFEVDGSIDAGSMQMKY